jgi:tetratricopeptide (TPR) repeat protein
MAFAMSGCAGLQYMKTNDLWANGDEAFDEGRYDDAIPYYDEIVSRDHDESRALLMRGIARERDGDPRGALRDLGDAGDLGETRATLYRINLNIARGDTSGAEADLSQLASAGLEGKDRVIQLTLLGTLRLKQNKPRLAAQNLERAIKEGAAYHDHGTREHVNNAHHNAAEAYYTLGDFERAHSHYDRYMGGGGDSSGADFYMLGLLAYLNGDYDASDAALSKADPALVAEGAKVLDDPSFGAGR